MPRFKKRRDPAQAASTSFKGEQITPESAKKILQIVRQPITTLRRAQGKKLADKAAAAQQSAVTARFRASTE